MKTVEKKRLTRSQMLAIILSSVLVLLVAASIVISIILANRGNDGPAYTLPEIRPDLNESIYGGMPIAYDRVIESEMKYMLVSSQKIVRDEQTGEDVKKTYNFSLNREDNNGEFWLSYDNGAGDGINDLLLYAPPILDAEAGFNYEQLYALEGSDGYGTMTMLSYLCSAVGTVYFTERIDLPADAAARESLLTEYGLAGEDSEITVVSFGYGKRDANGKFAEGEDKMHHITIGAPAPNGEGFYFRVDGRNCVYYTRYNTFKYAKLGFESFIKGSLIAAGLSSDKNFEPLLTTEFTEWKNEMHKEGSVIAGSSVIAVGNVLEPIKESAEYKPESGYSSSPGTELDFNLSELSSQIATDPEAKRIYDAFVGAAVGSHSDLYLTLISDLYSGGDMMISFGDKTELSYRYEITAIESIIDLPRAGGGTYECTAVGTAVGSEANLLRVSYNYYIGGERQNTVPRHAVIDLREALIPQSKKDELRASEVGELAANIDIEVLYNKDNAPKAEESLVITDIVAIFTPEGARAHEVTDNTYVSFRYYEKVGDRAGVKQSMFVLVSELKNTPKYSGIYDAIIGKKVGKDLNITAYSETYYYELLRSFKTYQITDIKAYLTSEEIVSFRFRNESERDPFYGESIYENLTGKYSLYGIDVDICQSVLRIIGGLGENTSGSQGLSGTTVAVGLTHENMLKYPNDGMGLYAYTLYFELPRLIGSQLIEPEDGGESIEDYNWDHELGFTLYISEVDHATGKRYVGSDMYNVIAAVDASVFEFLDHSFVDFWARRSMIMLDFAYVDTFKLEFFMEDVKGCYDFEITYDKAYVHPTTGYVQLGVPFEGAVAQDYYEVHVTESGDVMTNTALHNYSLTTGGKVALHKFYNDVVGGGQNLRLPNSVEWVGVSNFMLAFQVMQMVQYTGSLTDAEKALATEDNKLMRMTVGLDAPNANANNYIYEFYRVSDRKIMVKTYMETEAGVAVAGTETSDMYISTFAFKKMVNAYLSVFNAKEVNGEMPYSDMPIA